jgi:hypothetical protein
VFINFTFNSIWLGSLFGMWNLMAHVNTYGKWGDTYSSPQNRPRRLREKTDSSAVSLTSAVDGVGGQRHVPAAVSPRKNRYPFHSRLSETQGRSGRMRNIWLPPWFDTQTVKLLAIRCTDYWRGKIRSTSKMLACNLKRSFSGDLCLRRKRPIWNYVKPVYVKLAEFKSRIP